MKEKPREPLVPVARAPELAAILHNHFLKYPCQQTTELLVTSLVMQLCAMSIYPAFCVAKGLRHLSVGRFMTESDQEDLIRLELLKLVPYRRWVEPRESKESEGINDTYEKGKT